MAWVTMKKQYLKIFEGVCFKEDGWTDEEVDQFMDGVIDLAESFNGQLCFSCGAATEEELDEEDN